jgi:hypothetical protein
MNFVKKITLLAFLVIAFGINTLAVVNATSYPYTYTAGVPLEDMSSGTTQIIGPSADDTASAVTGIGFSFGFDGNTYTQFSATSNGLMRLGATVAVNNSYGNINDSGSTPKTVAYWDDLCTSSTGKVHYKLVGASPNQKLVVEWQNMIVYSLGCTAGVTVGTWQVWLNENGRVDLVYGSGISTNTAGFYTGIAGIGATASSGFASVNAATNANSYTVAAINTGAGTAGSQYSYIPPPPTVFLSSATYTVAENVAGGNLVVTVNRAGSTAAAATVDVVTANGTAMTPGDYTGGTYTASFAIGSSTTTVNIPIIDDTVFEPTETFTIGLQNASPGVLIGAPSTATVTITDNEPALAFSAATYSVAENVAGGNLVVTVNRTGSTTTAVSVDVVTANGTATTPGDYTGGTYPANIAIGSSTTTVNIPITDDAVFEPTENFTITLQNAVGAGIVTPSTATVSIVDNEPLPTGTYTVGTGGNYTSLTGAGGLFAAINAAGASGPVTINIISDLTGETGANTLNPIVGNPAVLIKPSGGSWTISGVAPIAVIRINGADNIRIDGSTAASVVGGTPGLRQLTVQNLSPSTTAGVIHIGSTTESSSGNTIQNVNVLGNDPLQTLTGISTGGATPGSTALFANNGTQIQNCSIQKVQQGIFTRGVSQTTLNTGTVISENDLSATDANRVRQLGIFVGNEDGISISQNSIGGIDTLDVGGDTFGIAAGIGAISDTTITTTFGVTNAVIARNKINGVKQDATFSAAGIVVAGIAGGTNTIANNMVTGVISDGNAGDLPAGIFVTGVTGTTTRLYYNSVAMTGDRGLLLTPSTTMNPSLAIAISGTNPTVELKNNIFYTTQTATGGGVDATSYAIGVQTTTFTNLDSDYNLFFSSGANDGGFRSGSLDRAVDATTEVDYVALAGWQAAVADDANSPLEADPVFVNPLSDLHLMGNTSPAYDKGIAVSVLDDFDGQIRSAVGLVGGVPDIGGDEFVAPSAANASIIGRVMTENGAGIRNAVVVVTGGSLTEPRSYRTNSFGYYRFTDLEVGQTYVLTINSKRFVFTNPTLLITLEDNVSDANFVAYPE